MSDELGATSPITPEDSLARFIFSSSHFSSENKRVKHNAFMPAPDGKTSVFRTKGLGSAAVWDIGQEVAKSRSQALHGRADITARGAAGVGLTVMPSEPPPRHCNIEGWPTEKRPKSLSPWTWPMPLRWY